MALELTATGRYYRVYVNGFPVSQHTTEREAIQKCSEVFDDYAGQPHPTVIYRHEYEVRAEMPVLLVSQTSASGLFTLSDLSNYDVSFFTTGTFATPIPPTTTSTHNVSTIGEFQTAVGVSGALINVAAGTYTGDLTFTGNDIDIVMDNGATLVGHPLMNQNQRIRCTGGNINLGTSEPSTGQLNSTIDVLFDNVNITGNLWFYRNTGAGASNQRLGFINCTIDGLSVTSGGSFTIFNVQDASTPHYQDILFANCHILNDVNVPVRLQQINRCVCVESYFSGLWANLRSGSSGFRFGENCYDTYVGGVSSKRTIVIGRMQLSHVPEVLPTSGGAVQNSVWDGIDHYSTVGTTGIFSGTNPNTGTVHNYSNFHSSGVGSPPALGPLTAGTGVDNVQSWDGADINRPSPAGYGADH